MFQCLWKDESGRKHKDGFLPSTAVLWIVSARERNLRYKNIKQEMDDIIDSCITVLLSNFSKRFFYMMKVGSIYS